MRCFHLLITCFCLSFLLARSRLSAVERPNLVVIYTDDMGYGDVSAFGATKIDTPHHDRIAGEGLKLTSFYVQPVCGPSRASLMTGRYSSE